MIALAATIVAAVGVGIASEHRWGEQAQRAGRGVLSAMLYGLVPFIVFFNIARLHVDVNVAAGLALGWAAVLSTSALAYLAATRLLGLGRHSTGAMVASVMQVNTGYVGLPLCVALLGAHTLGQAAAYDALVTAPILFLGVFAVGAAFGTKAGEGWRARTRAFFTRNPPLFAVIAALLAPDALAPDVLVHATRIAVFALIPLGFFAVGVTLAADAEDGALALPPPFTRPVAVTVVLRLVVCPLLIFLLAAPLIELPDPYLLQAAMPTGINTLVVAHAFGLDLRLASAAIAWTTAIVIAAGLLGAAIG